VVYADDTVLVLSWAGNAAASVNQLHTLVGGNIVASVHSFVYLCSLQSSDS